jgi:hypothetical protein
MMLEEDVIEELVDREFEEINRIESILRLRKTTATAAEPSESQVPSDDDKDNDDDCSSQDRNGNGTIKQNTKRWADLDFEFDDDQDDEERRHLVTTNDVYSVLCGGLCGGVMLILISLLGFVLVVGVDHLFVADGDAESSLGGGIGHSIVHDADRDALKRYHALWAGGSDVSSIWRPSERFERFPMRALESLAATNAIGNVACALLDDDVTLADLIDFLPVVRHLATLSKRRVSVISELGDDDAGALLSLTSYARHVAVPPSGIGAGHVASWKRRYSHMVFAYRMPPAARWPLRDCGAPASRAADLWCSSGLRIDHDYADVKRHPLVLDARNDAVEQDREVEEEEEEEDDACSPMVLLDLDEPALVDAIAGEFSCVHDAYNAPIDRLASIVERASVLVANADSIAARLHAIVSDRVPLIMLVDQGMRRHSRKSSSIRSSSIQVEQREENEREGGEEEGEDDDYVDELFTLIEESLQ